MRVAAISDPDSPAPGSWQRFLDIHLVDVSVFAPRLGYVTAKGVPVLGPDSILVHMAG